jgi:hypothetical protein
MNDRLYAVRDTQTGKLVSDITNPRRKYWDRKGNAEAAIRGCKWRVGAERQSKLKLVVFELVEVQDDR